MSWRAYTIRFGVAEGFRWYFRSERNPTSKQFVGFMLVMPWIAGFFVMLEVLWLLTGRGHRIRHALGHDQIQVVPGPRGMPPEFRRRLDALTARHREEFERMKAEAEAKRAQPKP